MMHSISVICLLTILPIISGWYLHPGEEIDEEIEKRYNLFNNKWERTDLTYGIHLSKGKTTMDMTEAEIKEGLRRSFKHWSDVSALTFTYIEDVSKADFKVSFGTGWHGDRHPFDGRGNTLAHAFSPSYGEIHFDDHEKFFLVQPDTDLSSKSIYGEIDFEWVATHEIGHAIGIDHSDVKEAVMWPRYKGIKKSFSLSYDDINAVQYLYPSHVGTTTTTPAPTTTTPLTTTQVLECIDKRKDCSQYVDYCNSRKWGYFMKTNCVKTCTNCNEGGESSTAEPAPEDCKDKYQSCKAVGICTDSRYSQIYRKRWCQKSCGLCGK